MVIAGSFQPLGTSPWGAFLRPQYQRAKPVSKMVLHQGLFLLNRRIAKYHSTLNHCLAHFTNTPLWSALQYVVTGSDQKHK